MSKYAIEAAAKCAAAIDHAVLAQAQAKARAGQKCNRLEKKMLGIEAERLQYLAMAR